MMSLTLQIVGKTLFDAELAGETGEIGAAFAVAMENFNTRMNSLLFLLPDSLPIPSNWRFLRAARRLDAAVYRIIDQRRASGEDRGDLLSMLLQARDEDDGGRMSDKQLRDEVTTLVLAGHETTAIALSWTGYLLALQPEAEARLLAELAADPAPVLILHPFLAVDDAVRAAHERLLRHVAERGAGPIQSAL
jgi:cytochrome P450